MCAKIVMGGSELKYQGGKNDKFYKKCDIIWDNGLYNIYFI